MIYSVNWVPKINSKRLHHR